MLHRGCHGVDIGRQADAAGNAQDNAGAAQRRALYDKYLHDVPRRCAQGAQHCDVSLFVRHHHHQGRDDVERRHRDDQDQYDEHHLFCHPDGMEIIHVSLGPVDHAVASRHIPERLPADPGRLHHVTGLQPQAGGVARAKKPDRIVQVDEHHGAVEFIHVRVIDPHHGKPFEPGQDARRRYPCRGRDQRYLVPRLRAQQVHQVGAQDDPEFSRRQRVQSTGNHFFRQKRYLRLRFRQYPAGNHALDLLSGGHHAFGFHVRGHAADARVPLRPLRDILPVPQ